MFSVVYTGVEVLNPPFFYNSNLKEDVCMVSRKLMFASLFVVVFLFLAFPAFAGQVGSAAFVVGQAEYVVDNVMPVRTDASPFVEQDRVFVPLRHLAGALGVGNDKVSWDSSCGKVTIVCPCGSIIELAVNEKAFFVNGQKREMDVAPVLVNGRVYLPARWVADALGYEVGWDEASQLVYCWPKNQAKPEVARAVEIFKDWIWEKGYKIPDPDGRLAYRGDWPGWYKTCAKVHIEYYTMSEKEFELSIFTLDRGGSEEGYKQAEIILASRFGEEFAKEVMAFAGKKKYQKDEIGVKEFRSPEGKRVVALGAEYDDSVGIVVAR